MADAQLPKDDTQASLTQSDAAFQELVQQHQALDEHIRHLSTLTYLTDEQQYQEAALKKRKLALKDRIAAALRHRQVADDTA